MALIKLILWILVSNELCFSIIATSGQSDKKLKRASPYWTPTASAHGFSSPIRSSNYFATYRRQTDSDDEAESDLPSIANQPDDTSILFPPFLSSTSSTTESPTDESKKLTIPKINFYSSTPNAFGMIGQGVLFLREVSASVGTPLPMWIGVPILIFISVGLMFLPDLTTLNLPLFYPNGAPGDPLAMFPPFLDLGFLADNKFVQDVSTRLLNSAASIVTAPPKDTKRRLGGGKLRRGRK